ncbi:MAG: heme b synthase [Candidatus Abyssobacteria bacterium SURF_17]|uniref:Heme b synthase n=1 Tax=Candidatus Abyssobacteria bacterium SURF_17 TaxID=2093361 RepID=A0A419F152_9BACT|nr:MAG: heme b synthase [Candidatus Abyssubacteria bacterium SURF_17]
MKTTKTHAKQHSHTEGRGHKPSELRLVAWEITRSCNLACIHCRASAERGPYPNELTTDECKKVLDEIASFSDPIIIFTGGEPLLRPDIFDILRYGQGLGLKMTMAVNGLLLDEATARRLVEHGIQRISISIDGATAETHDAFRNVPGAFAGAMRGIEAAKKAGLPFQINSTITKLNLDEIPDLLKLAVEAGAVAHHIFLLVPTGRGKELEEQEISPEQYEQVLNWFYEQREKVPIQLKATCAPHYYRILRERAAKEGKQVSFETYGMDAVTRGCLGGVAFCFISHTGTLSPCGYLELDCGNIRKEGFRKAWEQSPIFKELRDFSLYQGKCGKCRYLKVCGGCRARAYARTGNYLAEEPYCVYPGHE